MTAPVTVKAVSLWLGLPFRFTSLTHGLGHRACSSDSLAGMTGILMW